VKFYEPECNKLESLVNYGFSQIIVIHREPLDTSWDPVGLNFTGVDIMDHSMSTLRLFVVLVVIIMLLFTLRLCYI
jgi:hypothetical protein